MRPFRVKQVGDCGGSATQSPARHQPWVWLSMGGERLGPADKPPLHEGFEGIAVEVDQRHRGWGIYWDRYVHFDRLTKVSVGRLFKRRVYLMETVQPLKSVVNRSPRPVYEIVCRLDFTDEQEVSRFVWEIEKATDLRPGPLRRWGRYLKPPKK